jgi:prepilin-type N-terminal cleavage/methylation domain-containing protein
MLAGLRRRAVAASVPGQVRDRGGDAGFTLAEVLVAIMIIGIVMGGMTTFFVTTMSVTNVQGDKQTAVQLAADATERVRSLKGSAVAANRDKTSSDTQWASPVAGVAAFLSTMQETWDTSATYPAGATAPLPTQTKTSTVNGVAYGQNWYVGKCWQPLLGGDCATTYVANYVEFFRVIVAVTWPAQQCASSVCAYVTSTLVNNQSSEPVFNANETALPPTVTNPGNQVSDLSVPDSLQLATTGGAAPITFTFTGLPSGLTGASNGLVSGTPTTAGTFSVVATATDAMNLVGTAAFSWTVSAAPQLSTPADQTTNSGTAVSLTITRTGGTAPFTWTATAGTWGATGLPPGLSISSSGVVSGTPTTAGTGSVTVNVTDSAGRVASTTFNWTVLGSLKITTPAAKTSTKGTAITPVQVVASGGTTPYTWTASGLPAGLSINASTGVISGTPTTKLTYTNCKVTVKDSTGASATTAVFKWTIK